MSFKYPHPAHVFVPSFVTVKLSGKDMYGLWKKQMLCLFESHDMLDFINVNRPFLNSGSLDEDNKLWKRSDALVQGWILGSLSEQAAMNVFNHFMSKRPQQTDFTAKDIWDQLQIMYDQRADTQIYREPSSSYYNACMQGKQGERRADQNKRMEENLQLCLAAEHGNVKHLLHVLKNSQLKITDKITINGNTALHIAVACSLNAEDDGFLERMLAMLPEDISLVALRNSDGSTLLHVAASMGRIDAAKVLLKRSRDLLSAKDNRGCTPLDIVLSDPVNKNICFYLLRTYSAMPDIEQDTDTLAASRGEEFLVNAIFNGHFDLAKTLLQTYTALKTDGVLMAIAQHCPPGVNAFERFVNKYWQRPIMKFLAKVPGDIESSRKLARDVLDIVCRLIKDSHDTSSYPDFYTKPMLEAIKRDACDVVEKITYWFPDATMMVDEDGHNITQAAWKNRASKVLALITHRNMSYHTRLTQEIKDDSSGSNFLHFAAKLAPARKLDLISCPPFQLKRELQWFKAAQEIMPLGTLRKNLAEETPEMVFSREHKELLIESKDWIKSTASSYIVTATLIVTIVFAAAITVPGGNNEKNGVPKYNENAIFIVFEASIAIAMVTSSISLLYFLGTLNISSTEQDFIILPRALVYGVVYLFLSATFTMLAFGAALFLMYAKKYLWTFVLIAPLIGIPIFHYIDFISVVLIDYYVSILEVPTDYNSRRCLILGRIFI